MTQPTDPFAKGQAIRCLDNGGYPLTVGKDYEVVAATGRQVCLVNDHGVQDLFFKSRFEPVPAAGEECAACGATPTCDSAFGQKTAKHANQEWRLCATCWRRPNGDNKNAIADRHLRKRPAPPQPEQAKPAVTITCVGECRNIDHRSGCCSLCGKPEQAKADPYAAHRLSCLIEQGAQPSEEIRSRNEAARLRNIAALKAEHAASSKRSGLLETFPKDARNPR